jgi:hypothetical protein
MSISTLLRTAKLAALTMPIVRATMAFAQAQCVYNAYAVSVFKTCPCTSGGNYTGGCSAGSPGLFCDILSYYPCRTGCSTYDAYTETLPQTHQIRF